jgi:surface protein
MSNLKELHIRNFDTKNVIYMNEMFENCTSITELNLSNFNTEKVSNMSYMFSYCKSLLILNLSNSNITDANITKLFFGCDSLISLKLLSCKNQGEEIKKYLGLNDKCKIKLKNLILYNINN